MKRRNFLMTAGAGMALAALPVQAAQVPLNNISAYLNGIDTVKARFQQTNANGSRSTGTIWIQRPGRMRFEYDPPMDLLVLASGGQVGIFDGKSSRRERAERYPLKRTPLNLILERNVNLNRRAMVRDVRYDGKVTSVFAQDPDNPEYGYIELRFIDGPVRLAEWVVVDGSGSPTKVVLGDLQPLNNIPASYFGITFEEQQRSRGSD